MSNKTKQTKTTIKKVEPKKVTKKVVNIETRNCFPQPTNIEKALFKFQSIGLILPRNGRGKTLGGREYTHVTLDDLINVVHPHLIENGIMFTQLIQGEKLETILCHVDSGTKISSHINVGSPNSVQDYGGRITYVKRYALSAMLGLSTSDDPDGVEPKGETIPSAEVKPTFVPGVGKLEKPKVDDEIEQEVKRHRGFVQSTLDNTEKVEPIKEDVSLNNKSEPFVKAYKAIDSCYSVEALDLVKEKVEKSVKINDTERSELLKIALDKLSTLKK